MRTKKRLSVIATLAVTTLTTLSLLCPLSWPHEIGRGAKIDNHRIKLI